MWERLCVYAYVCLNVCTRLHGSVATATQFVLFMVQRRSVVVSFCIIHTYSCPQSSA